MGQLSIEPKEDKSAKIGKNKVKRKKDETIGSGQQQRWWVGSVGHDDILRRTDLFARLIKLKQAKEHCLPISEMTIPIPRWIKFRTKTRQR